MYGKVATVLFLIVVLGGVLVPRAAADEGNRKVLFSVNTPLEVPGKVLKPGRYELKLQETGGVFAGLWNATGTRFYGYFATTPVDRYRAPGNAEVVLTRSAKTAPLRLEEWFYPGDNTGNELLYSNQSKVLISSTRSAQQQIKH